LRLCEISVFFFADLKGGREKDRSLAKIAKKDKKTNFFLARYSWVVARWLVVT
jgi:hypothetical protein